MAKGKHWFGYARTIEIGVTTVGAGTSTEVPMFAAPFNCRITKISIVPKSAITGVATNNMILGFKNKGLAGSGTLVIGSTTFALNTNAAAYDEKDLGSVNQFNGYLPMGTVVTFYKSENGTGMIMPDLIAKIEIIRE